MAGVWTNNWANIQRGWAADMMSTAIGPVYSTSGAAVAYVKSVSAARPLNELNNGTGTGTTVCAVRFGTSNTAPSVNDYTLGEQFASGLTYISASTEPKSYDPQTGLVSVTSTVVIQNTAAADKIIREWGLFGSVNGYRSGSSSSTSYDVLFYRAVLDEPITLPQYYSLKLTITRTMQLEVLE